MDAWFVGPGTLSPPPSLRLPQPLVYPSGQPGAPMSVSTPTTPRSDHGAPSDPDRAPHHTCDPSLKPAPPPDHAELLALRDEARRLEHSITLKQAQVPPTMSPQPSYPMPTAVAACVRQKGGRRRPLAG